MNTENKTHFLLILLIGTFLICIFIYVLDPGVSNEFNDSSQKEISSTLDKYQTAYMVLCENQATDLSNCAVKDTAATINFMVKPENGTVIRWGDNLMTREHIELTGCVIVDKENWNCNDRGMKLGYSNGVFYIEDYAFGYPLTVSKTEYEKVRRDLDSKKF